jgi:hypothetical protein
MTVAWVTKFESSDESFIVGFYETEWAAYMGGVQTEFEYMHELYHLARKYEEPSDYYKCISRLGAVDWADDEARESWKKQHVETRELLHGNKTGKPRFIVWKCESEHELVLKKEADVLKEWKFEPVE